MSSRAIHLHFITISSSPPLSLGGEGGSPVSAVASATAATDEAVGAVAVAMTSSNWWPSLAFSELHAHPMVTVATLLGNETTLPATFNTHQMQWVT